MSVFIHVRNAPFRKRKAAQEQTNTHTTVAMSSQTKALRHTRESKHELATHELEHLFSRESSMEANEQPSNDEMSGSIASAEEDSVEGDTHSMLDNDNDLDETPRTAATDAHDSQLSHHSLYARSQSFNPAAFDAPPSRKRRSHKLLLGRTSKLDYRGLYIDLQEQHDDLTRALTRAHASAQRSLADTQKRLSNSERFGEKKQEAYMRERRRRKELSAHADTLTRAADTHHAELSQLRHQLSTLNARHVATVDAMTPGRPPIAAQTFTTRFHALAHDIATFTRRAFGGKSGLSYDPADVPGACGALAGLRLPLLVDGLLGAWLAARVFAPWCFGMRDAHAAALAEVYAAAPPAAADRWRAYTLALHTSAPAFDAAVAAAAAALSHDFLDLLRSFILGVPDPGTWLPPDAAAYERIFHTAATLAVDLRLQREVYVLGEPAVAVGDRFDEERMVDCRCEDEGVVVAVLMPACSLMPEVSEVPGGEGREGRGREWGQVVARARVVVGPALEVEGVVDVGEVHGEGNGDEGQDQGQGGQGEQRHVERGQWEQGGSEAGETETETLVAGETGAGESEARGWLRFVSGR